MCTYVLFFMAVYMFAVYIMLHILQSCDMHMMVYLWLVLPYEQIVQNDQDQLNCKLSVTHCIMNYSKVLPCRCAVYDMIYVLHVMIYHIMFHCVEIFVMYNSVSVMLL